jgi:PEP-CTERM motif
MKNVKAILARVPTLFRVLGCFGLLSCVYIDEPKAQGNLQNTEYGLQAAVGYPSYPYCCNLSLDPPYGANNTLDTSGNVTAAFSTLSGSASSNATLDAGNPNSMSVSAASTSEGVGATATASVGGSFVISGTRGDLIPIVVLATGSGSGTGGDPEYPTGGGASFGIGSSDNCFFGDCVDASGSFSIDQTVMIEANFVYGIGASASATAVDGTGEASVDPFIEIEPSFLAAHPGLSIEFSPGYLPSAGSATPEPSTWAMMLMGFTALAFAGYRASRKNIALAA